MKSAWAWRMAAVLAMGLASGPAAAKTYKCVDDAGHVTYSSFSCPVAKDVLPPPPTPTCPLSAEVRGRTERAEEQFLRRFPTDEAHRLATLGRLQPIVARIHLAQGRLDEFMRERRAIDNEREFYKGGDLPMALSRRFDASEAQFAAMADVLKSERADILTIMAQFDCEQAQFAVRWRGGAPGSSACSNGCR